MSHPHTDTELVKTALRGHRLTDRPQASRIADRKIVARLFPRSQRHGRAVAILTQSRRRAHDACIHHCGRGCLGVDGHMGGLGAACGLKSMPQAISSYSVEEEERILAGGTAWVAIRARGAEWSWLTPAEAAHLGQQWVERYGPRRSRPTATQDELTATD